MLTVTVPEASEAILAQAELLAVFAGLVAAATARVTGIPYVRRRGRVMSLPAGMRWDLLPPLSAHRRGADRRGARARLRHRRDAFGYAVNGAGLHFRSSAVWGTASARRC